MSTSYQSESKYKIANDVGVGRLVGRLNVATEKMKINSSLINKRLLLEPLII